MIPLPYEYQDYFNNTYKIVGWSGRIAQVKHPGGRVFILSLPQTEGLLQSLGINGQDLQIKVYMG